MQTSFAKELLQTKDGQRVNSILRNCVHCGFCNATCPTYLLTGDELDGPRGRIYLIKNFFEEKNSTDIKFKHLDRCLTCLSCETTCPSGVKYSELIDIGRAHIEKSISRPVIDKLKRKLIIIIFSHPALVSVAFFLARTFKIFLPSSLNIKIPAKPKKFRYITPVATGSKMLTIKGCVQNSAAPQINASAIRVLNKANIQLDEANSKCCGALAFHLTETDTAKNTIRNNIDNWYKKLTGKYDYLCISSSGCSHFVKQYGNIMQDEIDYADKASFISKKCKDLSEIAPKLKLDRDKKQDKIVAFHNPCTLQHGQRLTRNIEELLEKIGYRIVKPNDAHICCGSAGSYSLLETEFATKLLKNKVSNLEAENPDLIATANIGCLMHLQSAAKKPVKHWIELLDN